MNVIVFLFDTDTLSLYQHDHLHVLAALGAHASDEVVVSTITIDEQLSGWFAMTRAARKPAEHASASTFLIRMVNSWKRFKLVPYSVGAVQRFEQLLKLRLNVGRYDLKIAAIALELGATVVTRNRRDFGRVPGLLIEDWSV
jgi:tRNA(fMet)-specific endonuclease VapC